MGWLIALGIIVLVGFIPVGLYGSYCCDGAQLYFHIGPIRILWYPSEKRSKKARKQINTKHGSSPNKRGDKTTGGKLSDFLPIAKTILNFFGELIKKVKVKNLSLSLVLAGSDPCDLGVNYGRTCAAIATLEPHLDRLFVIKKKNISVNCDYTAEESTVVASLDLTICLARLLVLVIRYGIRAIKQYFILYNKRKGGTEL